MRAQDLFRAMLREQLAPELRRLGFKGSGQHYDLRADGGDCALLGFQKDAASTGGHVRFTINLVVVRGSGELCWRDRIGSLLDDPHDHWWTIRVGDDIAPVADHVLWLVRERALPQLRYRLGLGSPAPHRAHPFPATDCPWPFCTDEHRL